jgi:hypothetical protein
MSLPDRESARHWVDRRVVDASGAELGTCARVYADLETGAPEWLLVSRPKARAAVVPLLDATEADDRIQVQVAEALVATAPSPAGEERLSTEEEAALYEHYGVEYSADASDSILPAEVTEAKSPDTPDTPSDAEGTAAKPPIPPPAPKTWQPEIPAAPAPKSGVAKKAVLSGVAALFGVIVARRRLRVRPPAAPTKRPSRRARRRAAVRARSAGGLTSAQIAAKAATARTAAAANAAAARTAAATNITSARTAAATNLAATKAAAAANAARTKAAAAAKTAAAQAAANAKTTAAKTAAAKTAGRRERRRIKKTAPRATTSTGGKAAGGTRVKKKRERSTMGRIKTGLTLGAGYVLGTRAGRQRYEQLRRVSATVAQRPEVQRTTQRVSEAVVGKLPPAVAGKLPPSVASKLAGNPPPPPPSAY